MISFCNLSLKLAVVLSLIITYNYPHYILFGGIMYRMKMYEMKKAGRYGIGFIDPNTINEETWGYAWYQTEVEKNMLEFLKRLNTNRYILLPYNF